MNTRSHRRWLMLAPAVVAAVVVPAISPDAKPVHAEPDRPAEFENITPSAQLHGPELVAGTLVGTSDEKVNIYVYAVQPLEEPEPGDKQFRHPVSVSSTDGVNFNAIADPSVDLTKFVNSSGVVDFQIYADDGQRGGTTVFSRQLDKAGRPIETKPEQGLASIATEGIDESISGEPAATDPEVVTVTLAKGPDRTASASAANAGPHPACTARNSWKEPVHVGQSYHKRWGAKQRFTYKVGSESTLGWGLTIPGRGWSVGGSSERSNSNYHGIYFDTGPRATKQYHYTYYSYTLYHCPDMCCGPSGDAHYEVWSGRHVGGGVRRGIAGDVPRGRYCVPHSSRTGFDLVETRATGWSNGVQLSFMNLLARSGYSKSVGVHANFLTRMKVCGVYGYPNSAAGLIVYTR